MYENVMAVLWKQINTKFLFYKEINMTLYLRKCLWLRWEESSLEGKGKEISYDFIDD